MGDADLFGLVVAVRINEVYDRATIQGEGPHAGRACTFVRLYGCNLHCAWCDTPFTWDTDGRNGVAYPAGENRTTTSVDDVVAAVRAVCVPICVVSGGEPLIQAGAVVQLAGALAAHGIETHVETNGTRPPPDEDVVAHYSVSPKLASADAGVDAIRPDVLRMWAQHERACFKVVCMSPSDVRDAVVLFNTIGVPDDRRWIMPEGRTPGELDKGLASIIEAVLDYRLNLSPRLHVSLWGDERGR